MISTAKGAYLNINIINCFIYLILIVKLNSMMKISRIFRNFSSFTVETPGSIYEMDRETSAYVNILISEKAYNSVLKSFTEIESRFPSENFNLVKFCSPDCKSSLSIVKS